MLNAQQLPMPKSITVGKLDNGLTYYLVPEGEQGKVKVMMLSRLGALAETPAQHGYTHFIEHTLFNGSENYPANSSVEAIEMMGMRPAIDYNAYTSVRSTEYFMTIPENNFDYFKKNSAHLKRLDVSSVHR
jgi:Predicted Zn-dependent peptidases